VAKTEEEKDREIDSAAKAGIIKDHKMVLGQSIVDNKQIGDKDTKKLLKHLDDDKSIKDSTDKASGLKNKGKVSTLDMFKEALTFFAPQLIGGALAGMGGDAEGAVLGAEAGAKARDSFMQYKKDMKELTDGKTSTTTTYQQGKDWSTKDGKPVTFNPTTGKYEDLSGNLVPPEKIINMKNIRQGNSLKRADTRQELASDKFAHQVVKDGSLSGKQQEKVAQLDTTIKSGGMLKEAFEHADTGQLIGRYNSMKQFFDAASPEAVRLKAHAVNLKLFYQRAMSGLQVNAQEMAMIRNIIPNELDGPTTFMAKLEVFNELTATNRESFMASIRTGQPLKGEVVAELVKQGRGIEHAVQQTPKGDTMTARQKRILELKNKLKK
tara:strand:- start:324 stop:1463 length:1140 start_codon:yes stop_codon:yes gene_type:complete